MKKESDGEAKIHTNNSVQTRILSQAVGVHNFNPSTLEAEAEFKANLVYKS